jgi:predicted phage-related endonuclease
MWGDEGTGDIPIQYRCQTLWYLDVFGFDHCDVSVLIGGSDYREYVIERDEAELTTMRAKAVEFLDTLATDTMPALDGHEATYDTVKELHPGIEPISVELPAAIAEPYLDALADYKAAEDEKRRWTAEVAAFMGPAKEAWYGGTKVAGREAKTGDGALPYVKAARGAAAINRRSAA